MFKIRKSLSSFLVLLILAVLVLPGCRKKEPAKKLETYEGVELTYYKVFDDSDVMEPLLKEFELDHPGLKIHYRKFSDFDEYQTTILNEMAEGEGPDIFAEQNTWFKSNYRKVTPLPATAENLQAFKDTFVDVAYTDLVRPDEDGLERIYALPMTVDSLALYYNNDHFEDRLPEQGRPSTTWEGIKEDVVALTKQDNSLDRFEVSGIAMGRSDNIGRAVDILYLLFLQFGADFYNENVSKATFAGKLGNIIEFPALQALDLFTSFADDDQKHYSWNDLVVEPGDPGEEIKAFAEGKVSMIVGYSYTYELIQNYINLLDSQGEKVIDKRAVRVVPIPQLVDPKVSTDKRVTYASYFAETVSRTSKHPELAWDLLLFLTSKESLAKYFDKTKKPTSRRDMISDQKKVPIYGVFVSQAGYSESFPILSYYFYKDLFTKVIQDTLSDDPKSSLLDAQDKINSKLPKDGLIPKKVGFDEIDEES